jgi:glycosyltransferase involved in cell wall biosynthesis
LGTSVSWRWLGERSDVEQIIREHDALIHPSLFEGLPNVACEALACGRPVLISRVGDHPQIVKEGVTGFLFDPHDEEDIGAAIGRLLELDAEQYNEMCHRGRAFAEEHLSLQACAIAYEQVLEQSISMRRQSIEI